MTLELSLTGADADKYTLESPSATFDRAKITKAQLSAASFVDPTIQVIWRGEGYGPISGTLTANDFFAEGEVPEGAKIVAAGKASAEAERQSKLREADAQTTALARAMCEKLLARNLTAQDDARLLDDLLEKAGAGNGN